MRNNSTHRLAFFDRDDKEEADDEDDEEDEEEEEEGEGEEEAVKEFLSRKRLTAPIPKG